MDGKELLFRWSAETWDLLDKIGILWSNILAAVTIAGFVFGIFRRNEIRKWFRRNRFPNVGGSLTDTERYEGVVFTVSKPDVPTWVMEQVSPKCIGLVYTRSSEGAVQQLRETAGRRGIKSFIEEIADPDDPHDTKQATRNLLNRLRDCGLSTLAVDITGGKVPMSLGAFMAAEESRATSLYVACSFDTKLNRADMTTARLTRVSEPGT